MTAGNLATDLDAITGQIPPEINERLGRLLEEIAASGSAPGLGIGERAPEFTLPDARGQKVSLAARLAAGPVVLVFYRGEWCPYCNVHLRALQHALPAIRKHGASLVAISPQSPDHSLSMAEKAHLEFDVLSDQHQSVMRDYKVRFDFAADLQSLYQDVFQLDVRLQNAGDTWSLPIPATFVIGRDGIVAAAHVDADYRKRLEPAEILDVLAELS